MVKALLGLVFLVFPHRGFGSEAIYCNGAWRSLDHALISDFEPFGPIYKDDALNVGIDGMTLIYLIYFSKIDDQLNRKAKTFFRYLKNTSDFSAPMQWQPSGISFPVRMASAEERSKLPVECLEQDEVLISTVVYKSRQGDITAFEYDESILASIETSRVQAFFLYMSVFLRQFLDSPLQTSQINALLHTEAGFHKTPEELRQIFIEQGFSFEAHTDLCLRSFLVRDELQRSLGLPCKDITMDDLYSVESLHIKGHPQRHSILETYDFYGLKALSELNIQNLDSQIGDVTPAWLKDLTKLKSLRISGHPIKLVPTGFMEGPYQLTELDLSGNDISEFKRDSFRRVFTKSTDSDVILNLSNSAQSPAARNQVYIHPGAFNNCESLTHLNLSKMKLRKLKSEVFAPLIRLKFLDLSRNYIRKIVNHINSPSLSNLEELDLSSNPFEHLQESEFIHFLALTKIRLANTYLRDFPYFLLNLPSLKEIEFCSYHFLDSDYQELESKIKRLAPSLNLKICKSL